MADRVLFVGWGETVRGAEERGLEVFNESMGLYGRMQQDGRIESFDTVLFDPNGGMGGFIIARGSREQIDGMRADEEFQRNTNDAALIVDGLTHIEGYTNEGVAEQ
ncbi:MAG TPA: hypothetical protein VGY32_02525, partial [Solirubrobacteraceae bacterium]|nr:hypothetical protein [Solirubrobacteraceae bacterium]